MSPAKRLWLVTPRAAAPSKMNPHNVDVLNQLRQLGVLHQDDKLTQDEYEAKKAALRAQILTT